MSNPLLGALKATTTLAALTGRKFGRRRTDKSASAKANRDNNAQDGAGIILVDRLVGADELHNRLAALQLAATTKLKHYAMPFGDEPKWKMLPNVFFERYVGEVMPIVVEHRQLVENVLPGVAQKIIDDGRQHIGDYDVPMPTVDELVASYELTTDFRPIPESANFNGLDPNTIRKLQDMHDAKLVAAVSIAERDTLERFIKPLNSFVERMALYDEKLIRDAANPEKLDKNGSFRDTIITNIQELHDMLGSFCISGDPRFTELGNLLDSLRGVTPKELREDDNARAVAVTRAQEIANNLKGWLA